MRALALALLSPSLVTAAPAGACHVLRVALAQHRLRDLEDGRALRHPRARLEAAAQAARRATWTGATG